MNLVIRVDANLQIGMGHIMRCFAIGRFWREKKGKVVFLSKCSNYRIQKRILESDIAFINIEDSHSDNQGINIILEYIQDYSPCLCILDGYHFDEYLQKPITEINNLLVIDDNAHLSFYHAQYILNVNMFAERLKYNSSSTTHFFLGPHYIILRPEFDKWASWIRDIPPMAKKLLVTLGGSNTINLLLKIIRAIKVINDVNLEVIIVCQSNGDLEPIKSSIQNISFINLLVDVENMADLMAWADFAISAGGITCWELAYMGVPFISIIIAENQYNNVKGLAKKGVTINLGWYENLTEEEIISTILELCKKPHLRKIMSDAGRLLVDGKGFERLSNELG